MDPRSGSPPHRIDRRPRTGVGCVRSPVGRGRRIQGINTLSTSALTWWSSGQSNGTIMIWVGHSRIRTDPRLLRAVLDRRTGASVALVMAMSFGGRTARRLCEATSVSHSRTSFLAPNAAVYLYCAISAVHTPSMASTHHPTRLESPYIQWNTIEQEAARPEFDLTVTILHPRLCRAHLGQRAISLPGPSDYRSYDAVY